MFQAVVELPERITSFWKAWYFRRTFERYKEVFGLAITDALQTKWDATGATHGVFIMGQPGDRGVDPFILIYDSKREIAIELDLCHRISGTEIHYSLFTKKPSIDDTRAVRTISSAYIFANFRRHHPSNRMLDLVLSRYAWIAADLSKLPIDPCPSKAIRRREKGEYKRAQKIAETEIRRYF